MKFPIALLPVALCAMLVSPSAGAVQADTVEGVKAAGIVFQPLKGAGTVAVRTKGQRVAAFGLGMVVGNAMGSPVGNLQDAMQVAQISSDLTQRGINEFGHQRVAQQGPAVLVQAALQAWAGSAGVPVAQDTKAGYEIALRQDQWSLDYEGMFKDDYILSYSVTATLKAPGARRASARGSCQGQFEQKRPLSEWQANDHAAVAEASRQIGPECAVLIAHMLGLADRETITALIGKSNVQVAAADTPAMAAGAMEVEPGQAAGMSEADALDAPGDTATPPAGAATQAEEHVDPAQVQG